MLSSDYRGCDAGHEENIHGFPAAVPRANPGTAPPVSRYCIDATFVTSDSAKFLAGSFAALAAMIHLELSHVRFAGSASERCLSRSVVA